MGKGLLAPPILFLFGDSGIWRCLLQTFKDSDHLSLFKALSFNYTWLDSVYAAGTEIGDHATLRACERKRCASVLEVEN